MIEKKRPHEIGNTQMQAINSKGLCAYLNLALAKK